MEEKNEPSPQEVNREKGAIKKSPQELAAQVIDVPTTFLGQTKHPQGGQLDEEYREVRKAIEDLLNKGVDDKQLGEELESLYAESKEKGIYSPLTGQNGEQFLLAKKEYYLKWGYSEEEAEARAREVLSGGGYLGELRMRRRNREREINNFFYESIQRHPISEKDEAEKIRHLRKRVIYIGNPEQAEMLSWQFPGGNFLYHGTRVGQAIEILESGSLASARALYEAEEERSKKERGEKRFIRRNSGYEGISWSFNEIGALPGDRYHLVGFLASPQEVLTKNQQLAIPSRPAPYELIQIDGGVDINKYFSLKTQQELFIAIGLGESNSVWSNIVQLFLYRENKERGVKGVFTEESMLQNFFGNNADEKEIEKKLKSLYIQRENGTILLSPDLLQQANDGVPVAAVWLQALIDTGRIKNIPGFEDIKTVRQAVQRISSENYKVFLRELLREETYLENLAKEEEEKITPILVPLSKLYLVIPSTDLEKYLKVLARCEVYPRGIIVYDHMKVRLENFASMHRGDHMAMTKLLREAIPPREGYINYEEQLLGEKITPEKMVGYRKHVIGERYLKNRRTLRKNDQGELVIE
ncbi:hypothetical protein KBI33_00580 [Candidatus Shapirobacteria bacterium]|nr:hypothetical protein [Candidatus Shapirobacteria bacterium]